MKIEIQFTVVTPPFSSPERFVDIPGEEDESEECFAKRWEEQKDWILLRVNIVVENDGAGPKIKSLESAPFPKDNLDTNKGEFMRRTLLAVLVDAEGKQIEWK